MITVFIVDDHTMVREGLAALVGKNPNMQVVGQCGDGLSAIEAVSAVKPKVVLLDITMPGLNGLDICRELSRKVEGMAILMLTMHDDEQFIAKSLENGASGYLLKEAAAGQLTDAIETVARGEVFLGPGIPSRVIHQIGKRESDPYETLTARERQVLQQIAEGKTNRQVAEQLQVAIKTVDTHRSRLMRKLNIHDQTSLVKFALRKGVVSLD